MPEASAQLGVGMASSAVTSESSASHCRLLRSVLEGSALDSAVVTSTTGDPQDSQSCATR